MNTGKKTGTTLVVLLAAGVGVLAVAGVLNQQGMLSFNSAETPTISPTQAVAESTPAVSETNPVVAKVGADDILKSDVEEFVKKMGPQANQVPLETIYPLVLEQLVNSRILQSKVLEAGIATDAEVVRRSEDAAKQIAEEVYLTREVEARLTPEKIAAKYAEFLKGFKPETEVKARHILVETEEKANEAITKLDGGADFGALVTEYSEGPAAANGGDLGYFTRAQMVPEFAEAAFGLEKNTYTETPIKTDFGYHVILVEDIRDLAAPTLEELTPKLKQEMAGEVVREVLNELRTATTVTLFGLDGKPLPEPVASEAAPESVAIPEDQAGTAPVEAAEPAAPADATSATETPAVSEEVVAPTPATEELKSEIVETPAKAE